MLQARRKTKQAELGLFVQFEYTASSIVLDVHVQEFQNLLRLTTFASFDYAALKQSKSRLQSHQGDVGIAFHQLPICVEVLVGTRGRNNSELSLGLGCHCS